MDRYAYELLKQKVCAGYVVGARQRKYCAKVARLGDETLPLVQSAWKAEASQRRCEVLAYTYLRGKPYMDSRPLRETEAEKIAEHVFQVDRDGPRPTQVCEKIRLWAERTNTIQGPEKDLSCLVPQPLI